MFMHTPIVTKNKYKEQKAGRVANFLLLPFFLSWICLELPIFTGFEWLTMGAVLVALSGQALSCLLKIAWAEGLCFSATSKQAMLPIACWWQEFHFSSV